jgi:hypothetical protein
VVVDASMREPVSRSTITETGKKQRKFGKYTPLRAARPGETDVISMAYVLDSLCAEAGKKIQPNSERNSP